MHERFRGSGIFSGHTSIYSIYSGMINQAAIDSKGSRLFFGWLLQYHVRLLIC
jgi:hypothetical protein